jgi:AcrR family transcriptional regulator
MDDTDQTMSKQPPNKTAKLVDTNSRRLSRNRWLAASLAVLRDRGAPALTVDELTKELGVSKGSFYWHFENYTAFLKALAEYWRAGFTDELAVSLGEQIMEPEARLRFLSETIIREGLGKLDLQFRSLAISHSVVREVVERVDQTRINTLTSVFRELGFEGDALSVRAHSFIALHALEDGLHGSLSDEEKLRTIDERIRLFLGR